MKKLKSRSAMTALTLSALFAAFLLTVPIGGIVFYSAKAIFSKTGGSFWREWLPSHILNTVVTASVSSAVSLFAGLLCGLYLVIYGGKKSAAVLKTLFAALSALPAAVYGLFGSALFFGMGFMRYSVAAGIITCALLLFSTAARCCISALERVNSAVFSASLSLGATELESVSRVLLPSAARGIISGGLFCLSRAAGESASLIFTCGTGLADTENGLSGYLFSSGETLAVGIYQAVLNGELSLAFAACGMIILMMALLNIFTALWGKTGDKDR